MRSLVVILCLGVLSQAAVSPPFIGIVRYPSDNSIRPIYGIPSSFIPGQPILTGVQAASFSNDGGIVATGTEIRILDRSGNTLAAMPSGNLRPVLNITGAVTTALAWLPPSQCLIWFDGASFHTTAVPFTLPGPVLAIGRQQDTALLLVQEKGTAAEIAVDLASGNLIHENATPEVTAPAIYSGSSILFTATDGLTIRDASGSIHSLPGNLHPLAMERMSASWIHVLTSAGEFAVNPEKNHVSQLPGVRP